MSVAWGFLITRVADKNKIFHKVQQVSHARLVWLTILLTLSHIPSVWGDKDPTSLAGQPYQTELFGKDIHIPSGDRRHVTAINVGMNWIPDGPSRLELLPFGALFMWRNWTDENRRFNDIRYQRGLTSISPWFTTMTFENVIIPFGRYEYVEGQPIKGVELEWNYIFAGFGLGYRMSYLPGIRIMWWNSR